jgi:hydrogenase maturation factor
MSLAGLRLAAIYGFTPCRLGFCGSGNNNNIKILEQFIKKDNSLSNKARQILIGFEAAYPYYQLIAKVNKIHDPFDLRVVEAYWVGNKLLDKVDKLNFSKMISTSFIKPGLFSQAQAQPKIKKIPNKFYLHHSWHVLFIGSVTGRVNFTPKIVNLCVPLLARVKKTGEKALVLCRVLKKIKKNKWQLSDWIEKKVIHDTNFINSLKTGDMVVLHWGRVCQKIKSEQADFLANILVKNIKSFNQLNEQRRLYKDQKRG